MAESGEDALLESPQVQNYLRLQYLLGVTATNHLRELFTTKWKANGGSDWKNVPENGNKFVQNFGETLFKNAKRIQKKYLKEGNITMWDLPLLVDALNCFPVNQGLKCKKDKKSFEKLKEVRNQQAHFGSIEMDEETFNRLLEDASDALLSLGLSPNVLEAAKTVKLQTERTSPEAKIIEENQKKANDLKDQGNLHFKEKNFTKAIQLYSQGILIPNLLNDYLAVLYSNRSISYLKSGDFQNAKEDAKGAMHLSPTWWRGYYRLASVYEKKDQFEKAIIHNEIALGLSPSNAEVIDARDFCRHMIKKRKRMEHTDPINFSNTTVDKRVREIQKLNYERGIPLGICGEAHRHLHGIDTPQNYEIAARLFAKAAAKGNAEGIYNLAILTLEGKGVQRNVAEATALLFAAAKQDPLETVKYSGDKFPNLGVMEAQHTLGLAYHDGIGVPKDFDQAIFWYKKALKNNFGNSANNLALMYFNGEGVDPNIRLAFDFWKIGALKGCIRAMENMAHNYLPRDLSLAQKWYTVGVEKGSVTLPLHKDIFFLNVPLLQEFDSKSFLEEVKAEITKGSYKEYFSSTEHDLKVYQELLDKFKSECDPLSDEYKKEIILNQRYLFNETNKRARPKMSLTTQPPILQPKPLVDLFGLKPIFLKDMDQKNDNIYEGFGIKLTMIEDALVGEGRKSVGLIAKDENGDVQRVYLYNYPQNKETQEAFGFGSRITVVNPYFRVTDDGKPAIRIDDPSLLFIHANLKDPNQCRFCGKEKGTVICRKCRRVYYCSKLCLKKDAEELRHERVCVKRLFII